MSADHPTVVEKVMGYTVRSTTDEGAILELLDAFGLLLSPRDTSRDYDAEAARMKDRA